MIQEKFCQSCNQKNQCQEVYKKLANCKGTPVVFKVIIAFLLPIVVFIVTLAIFERIISGLEIAAELRVVFSTVASLLATVVFVFIIRASKPPNKFGG